MRINNPLKIIKDEREKGFYCFRIFGLNIFTVNTPYFSKLKHIQDEPFIKFIISLMNTYEIISLIGSPAPQNWIEDMKTYGKSVTLQDLMGDEINYYKVSAWYYGGDFGGGSQYGPSLLFKLDTKEKLQTLVHTFIGWDALALIICEKDKNNLSMIKKSIETYSENKAIINSLIQNTKYLMLSQGDCQYLEFYTKDDTVEDELKKISSQVAEYIVDTEWFRNNEDILFWDEMELAYVIRKIPGSHEKSQKNSTT